MLRYGSNPSSNRTQPIIGAGFEIFESHAVDALFELSSFGEGLICVLGPDEEYLGGTPP